GGSAPPGGIPRPRALRPRAGCEPAALQLGPHARAALLLGEKPLPAGESGIGNRASFSHAAHGVRGSGFGIREGRGFYSDSRIPTPESRNSRHRMPRRRVGGGLRTAALPDDARAAGGP